MSSDKNTTKINENLYHTIKSGKKKSKFHEQIERILKKKFCSGEQNRINHLQQINEIEKEDDIIIDKKDSNHTTVINYEGNNTNNNIRRSSTKKKEMQNNNQNENNNNIILSSSANAIIELEHVNGTKNKLELLNVNNDEQNCNINKDEKNNKCIIV